MTRTDRFGNNMDDLLQLIQQLEEIGVDWFKSPHRVTIEREWPQFYAAERRKRVRDYLDQRRRRPKVVRLPAVDDFDGLGLF